MTVYHQDKGLTPVHCNLLDNFCVYLYDADGKV